MAIPACADAVAQSGVAGWVDAFGTILPDVSQEQILLLSALLFFFPLSILNDIIFKYASFTFYSTEYYESRSLSAPYFLANKTEEIKT